MKKWFSIAIVSLLALVLTACGGDEGAGTGTEEGGEVALDFWVFGSTGYNKLIEEYEEAHPNVNITLNEGEMEDMHNNLFTSISAGSGAPDIALVEVSQIAKFMQAKDRFHNLNDYGAEDVADNFLGWKWQQAQSIDGSFQLGLPTDIGPTTMFYRTDVIEAAGLPTDPEQLASEIDSWDAYYEVAKKIKEETGKPIADSPELVFNAIRDQQPQQYFNEDNELIIEDTVKDAYDFTTKMIQEGLIGQNSLWTPEWGGAMADGSYATMPGAPAWMIGVVKGNAPDSGGDWSLTTIPEGAGNWGGSFLTIPDSDHPQEAFDFIAWLTAPEQQLKSFNDMGLFPSAPEVFEAESFLETTDEYFSGVQTAKIFAEAAKTVKPVYMGINYAMVNNELSTAIINVAVEGSDPQTEWDKAVDRIEQQLSRQ